MLGQLLGVTRGAGAQQGAIVSGTLAADVSARSGDLVSDVWLAGTCAAGTWHAGVWVGVVWG